MPNRTEVVILQHPRERGHPIGTARIALLGLERARLFTWGYKEAGAAENIEAFRRSLPATTVFLYPDPEAPEASSLSEPPEALLVVDGTWSTVKRMLRHAPWVLDLPRVRINPSQPGQYRLRSEPSDQHLSTIEAIIEALRGIEPDTPRLDHLFDVFQQMIDRQVPFVEGKSTPRFRVRQTPRKPRVPAALLEDANVVVVGGEYASTDRTYRWVAHRLATGEVLDCWLSPPPTAHQLGHMGVSADQVGDGVSRDRAEELWREFARPDDLRIGWSERVMRNAPGEGGIALKRVYCGVTRARAGHLTDVVAKHSLTPPAPAAPGRTGERLADLVAVLHWLRTQ